MTHPNDLVASEEATFDFLIDGKPAADPEIELVADGIRYRDGTDAMKFKTDAKDGVDQVPRAGLFWLNTDAKDNKTTIAKATERRLELYRHSGSAALIFRPRWLETRALGNSMPWARRLEPLTQPLTRRCFALSYSLYCLRLRARQPQICDLLGCVSGS